MYEKKMAQVPLGPLFGKQNIQAKEVFFSVNLKICFGYAAINT